MRKIIFLLFAMENIFCEIYFYEEFFDESYTERWVESTYRGIDQGKFQLGTGKHFGDYWKERGLQTSQNSKFYGIATKFKTPFNNSLKPLVIQYQVKMDEYVQCGGGYIKLLGTDFDPLSFHGHTPYKIMFGPDICGTNKKMVHVILNYKEKYYLTKKDIRCMDDKFSHLYTLIIFPNNTYSVLIDNNQVEGGKLEDDWDLLPPKKVKDPNAMKPVDWVDNDKIDDPNDFKPEEWDQPKTIPDNTVKKPNKWDDEVDGVWEPPLISNPNFKGEWKPKKIDNPNYKGPWIHPEIDNPHYYLDHNLYLQTSIGGVGFDIWQVVSGTIFDNILLTDDPETALRIGETTWRVALAEEKKNFEFQRNHELAEQRKYKKISDDNDSDEAFDDDEDNRDNWFPTRCISPFGRKLLEVSGWLL